MLDIQCSVFCQNTNSQRNLFQSPLSTESTAAEHEKEEAYDTDNDEMEI